MRLASPSSTRPRRNVGSADADFHHQHSLSSDAQDSNVPPPAMPDQECESDAGPDPGMPRVM